jgi:hypothetical protein
VARRDRDHWPRCVHLPGLFLGPPQLAASFFLRRLVLAGFDPQWPVLERTVAGIEKPRLWPAGAPVISGLG